jgi:hypothetical protein
VPGGCPAAEPLTTARTTPTALAANSRVNRCTPAPPARPPQWCAAGAEHHPPSPQTTVAPVNPLPYGFGSASVCVVIGAVELGAYQPTAAPSTSDCRHSARLPPTALTAHRKQLFAPLGVVPQPTGIPGLACWDCIELDSSVNVVSRSAVGICPSAGSIASEQEGLRWLECGPQR